MQGSFTNQGAVLGFSIGAEVFEQVQCLLHRGVGQLIHGGLLAPVFKKRHPGSQALRGGAGGQHVVYQRQVQAAHVYLWGQAEGGEGLETRLEDGLEKRMGLRTDFMVRTPAELRAIIAANPFHEQATTRPNHLLVNFLKVPIEPDAVEILRAAMTGREEFHAEGRELYIDFKDGIGESMLDRDWKKTKRYPTGTTRNWNTVGKLAQMVDA